MKKSQKAGIVGGILSLSYLAYNVYVVIRISKTFPESLFSELVIAITAQIPMLAPAIVLIFCKHFKKNNTWIFWLYPVVLGLGLINLLLSKDPISAGLPMVLLVFPFCIIYAIVLLFLKKRNPGRTNNQQG